MNADFGDIVEYVPDAEIGIFTMRTYLAYSYYLKALEILDEYGCTYAYEFETDIYYRIGKCLYKGNGAGKDGLVAINYLEPALNGYKSRNHDEYNYVDKRNSKTERMFKHRSLLD